VSNIIKLIAIFFFTFAVSAYTILAHINDRGTKMEKNKDHKDHKDHSSWSRFDFFWYLVEDPDTEKEVDCYVGYYWGPSSRGIFVDGMQVTPHEPSQIEEVVLMDANGVYSESLSDLYANTDQADRAIRSHTDEQADFPH